MIYRSYCDCKNPEPEELEVGLIVCLRCKNEIERHEDAPEPDEDDFSTCGDLPLGSDHQYESDRIEAHTGERDMVW